MYVQVKFYTRFENDALNKHLTSAQFQFISQTEQRLCNVLHGLYKVKHHVCMCICFYTINTFHSFHTRHMYAERTYFLSL